MLYLAIFALNVLVALSAFLRSVPEQRVGVSWPIRMHTSKYTIMTGFCIFSTYLCIVGSQRKQNGRTVASSQVKSGKRSYQTKKSKRERLSVAAETVSVCVCALHCSFSSTACMATEGKTSEKLVVHFRVFCDDENVPVLT
ncbi:unnamed protein product [Pylaiella littoralis]